MRRRGVLAFAFLTASHCGPPSAGTPDERADDERTEVAETQPDRATSSPSLGRRTPRDLWRKEARPISLFPAVITAEADGGGGVRYVAGTFAGTIILGVTTLTSHGDDDVFLARLDPNGDVAWARAIGGAFEESVPHLALEHERVMLFAMTRGGVDCGAGSLNTWSTEMFFVCVFDGAKGTPLGGNAFPTGNR